MESGSTYLLYYVQEHIGLLDLQYRNTQNILSISKRVSNATIKVLMASFVPPVATDLRGGISGSRHDLLPRLLQVKAPPCTRSCSTQVTHAILDRCSVSHLHSGCQR